MDKYIWYLYDMNTGCFGSGKLVYQKRKNGLFYDGKTHKPLIPQPQYLGQENQRRAANAIKKRPRNHF